MSLWYLNENPLRSVLCNEHKNVHILYPTVHILINSYGTLVWYLIIFVCFMKTIHYTMVHVGTSSGFRRTSTVDRKENIALFLRACINFKVKVSPEVCLYWSLETLKTSKSKSHLTGARVINKFLRDSRTDVRKLRRFLTELFLPWKFLRS